MNLVNVCKRLSLMGGCLLSLTVACSTVAAAQSGPYKIQSQWKIGGEGGWDYLTVDPQAHLLYITHGTRVEIIDTKTGKSVGSITGLQGIHGVALDDQGKLGYVSDGRANAVIVFDRSTFKTVSSIPVGTNPDGIVYEPVTRTVWAFNGRSNDVTVIDTSTQKVVATIALSGKPEFPVADGKGIVFDNIESKNSIARLDAKTLKLTDTWPLAGCESPSGLAIDQTHRRLFSVCDGKKMAVTDADSGKVLATPEIGDGPDAAAFDPSHQVAFSSNGDGTLTVVSTGSDQFKVVQNVSTQKGARTMTLDPSTGRAYLVTAEFGPRPEPTAQNPRPRPAIVPDSFVVLVVGRE
jgi:YVTN family beta-propeller protein